MRKLTYLILILLLSFNSIASGQEVTSEYSIYGVIRDRAGAVAPGLSLSSSEGKYGALSDINGEFHILLSSGDHTIRLPNLRMGFSGLSLS